MSIIQDVWKLIRCHTILVAMTAAMFVTTTALRAQVGDTTMVVVDSTTATDSPPSLPIRVTLQGAHYYQNKLNTGVSAPEFFATGQDFNPEVSYLWRGPHRTITDNPLHHGAGYVRVGLLSEPLPGLSLSAGVTGENRGMSYGVRDTKNMTLFPDFLFSYRIGLPFLGDTLTTSVKVGDFPAFRSSEPLMVYNMDVQGALFSVGWRSFEYYFEKAAGDLAKGLGLNIDDANNQGVRVRDIVIADSLRLTAQVGLFIYPQLSRLDEFPFFFNEPLINSYYPLSPRGALLRAVSLRDYGYTAQLALTMPRLLGLDLRAVTSLALRDAEAAGMMMNRMAFLAQVEASGRWERGALDARAEYRYYGGLFNNGFRNDDPAYRDPERTPYSNTIGPFLYPLRNLDYPFSQWAVFTEYQDLKDVTAWTLYLKGKLFLIDRFVAHGTLDLNYVVPEKTDAFLYPFFSAAVGYEPIDDISATIGLSNRAMNLDKHYPTYYLLTAPTLEATIWWLVK